MTDAAPRKSRWGWIVGAAAIVAVALAALAFRGPSGAPVPTARATRRALLVPITSDGTLEPPPGGELRAPGNAAVRAILVAEGRRVAKGTPLVRLEDSELEQSALAARSSAVAMTEERTRAAGELEQARR